tara:strand:- start:161 stop:499 length:339 start_codon:yes stop_codon:yes gene_type:complete
MKLGGWKTCYNVSCDQPEHSICRYTRSSEERMPANSARRSWPTLQMIITNQNPLDHKSSDDFYHIYLADSEYGQTYYGSGYKTVEEAKFVADLKLIEIGFEIESPFLLDKDK